MSHSEGQQDADKEAIAAEKLLLEKRLLQRQLSTQGTLITWLQAASVPVALLGAILAFFVGFGQLRLGADNQAAERFDKALARLASERSDERLTGVSGLNLFLDDRSPQFQRQALYFLVNRLSLETNQLVQGAILDLLADLPQTRPSQQMLDYALRTAIERNRSLTKSIADNLPQRILAKKKAILVKFKVHPEDIIDEIPAQVLESLSSEQYLALLEAEQRPFDRPDATEGIPLAGLAKAIQTLLAVGATSNNFSSVYCENCNFASAKSLNGASFAGAYLMGADFSHVGLREASFKNADIGGANFFAADLTKADLTMDLENRELGALRGDAFQLPLLECAKLSGADLTGLPLLLFVKGFSANPNSEISYDISTPRMMQVQLDSSTKLDKFSVIIVLRFRDAYIKKYSTTSEVQPLIKHRIDREWDNPLAENSYANVELGRRNAKYAENPAELASTDATMVWSVDPGELNNLTRDAFTLRGYADQPVLNKLELYSRFAEAVKKQKIPDARQAKQAAAQSDKAAQLWSSIGTLPCGSEHGWSTDLLVGTTYAPM